MKISNKKRILNQDLTKLATMCGAKILPKDKDTSRPEYRRRVKNIKRLRNLGLCPTYNAQLQDY